MDKSEEINLVVNHLIESWGELTQCLMQHPEMLVNSQLSYWNDFQSLYQDLSQVQSDSDKRFKHTEWQSNLLLNFIKKSYLLTSMHIETLINNIVEKENKEIAKKLRFFARQYIDAISPTNFANFNPEVLAKIAETNGENLLTGFKQLIEDIQQGNGRLNIKMTDTDLFKLGENIACTPGKIVYQNQLMQLIQYTTTTNKVYQFPLLIIPPWINKYYILDLQQENSLVKWLVDQGFVVFMISWVNPTIEHKDKQFSDYMFEGPLSALNIIKNITGEKQVNILGYCIGGTLLGCMLAYLSKKNHSTVLSATFLTTLLDFSEPGELGVFLDEKQINLLENHMKIKGYLDGRIMAAVFNTLRANDLIWASFINNYLKGQKPKPFDLLYWNSDATNIPADVHSFYLKNMYLHNLLVQKNKIKLADVSLDLSKIKVPSYFLAAHDDHIVPWATCFKGSQILNGPTQFVLTKSGHVAGVINPPHQKKYGYWITNKNNITAENFIAHAMFTEGSWWNHWVSWLKQYTGKMKNSNKMETKEVLEDAPGSYVKQTIYTETNNAL